MHEDCETHGAVKFQDLEGNSLSRRLMFQWENDIKMDLNSMCRCELDWSVVGYLLVVGSLEKRVSIKEVNFLGSGPAVSVWNAPHLCEFSFLNTGTAP